MPVSYDMYFDHCERDTVIIDQYGIEYRRVDHLYERQDPAGGRYVWRKHSQPGEPFIDLNNDAVRQDLDKLFRDHRIL